MVADGEWVGAYELPTEGQLGVLRMMFRRQAAGLTARVIFRNQTLGFDGSASLLGDDRGGRLSLRGILESGGHTLGAVEIEGARQGDILEGTFRQESPEGTYLGRFAAVRPTKGWVPLVGLAPGASPPRARAIDLGAATSGLLGPGRADAYGPGVNADATGRPFSWRTEQGEAIIGPVKPNAYGLGVGMDQFGRPVRATPFW
ncbi:MAG: hypothetical protein U0807_10545 [Candidatus Binatia bacterium]